MLTYVDKLTRTPGKVDQDDVDKLRAVGFDDRQVLDIIMICANFNFMTRLADGTGIRADDNFRNAKQRRDAQVEAELNGQAATA